MVLRKHMQVKSFSSMTLLLHIPEKLHVPRMTYLYNSKNAYPILNRLGVKRRELVKNADMPSHEDLLVEFISRYEMQYFHLCRVFRILLSIPANTGWIERNFTKLNIICEPRRNHLEIANIEALYLLSVLNVPLKDSYEEEIKIMEK